MSRQITWGRLAGIRFVQPTDAVAFRRFMLDPEVADLLFEEQEGIIPSALSMVLAIWVQGVGGRPDWAILDREKQVIGRITLWRISEHNRSAMLTIYIGERHYWGRGYGTDTLRLVLRIAFDTMRLQRVELNVFEYNERAISSYEKVGFVWEGIRRKALRRGSGYYDIIVMGLLKEEFLSRDAEMK